MLSLVGRRFLQGLPMLLLVSLVAFGVGNASLVDPAQSALAGIGTGTVASPEAVEEKREQMGLNDPIHVRYVEWVADALRGDLGTSFVNGGRVSVMITDRLPASLALGAVTMILALGVAIPVGMLAARRPGSVMDLFARILSLFAASVPGFWLALIFIWIFAAKLQWFPSLGSFTLAGMVLPVLVLSFRPIGRFVRLMRVTTMEVLQAEHIRVARGRGLSERVVLRRHVRGNAILPILSVIGLDFAALIGEVAVIEWVFGWPGIGRMGVDAAVRGDLPVLMGFTMTIGIIVILTNLVIDVVTGILDPRLRERAPQ